MGKGLKRSMSQLPEPADGGAAGTQVIKINVNETVTVSSTGAAIGFGTAVIQGLPEAAMFLIGAIGRLAFAGSGSDANLTDTWSGDFGIGTTPIDDATITSGDEDLIPETEIGPATGEAIAQVVAVNPGIDFVDNTSGTREININLLIDAANIADDTSVDITVTGELWLAYVSLGDD